MMTSEFNSGAFDAGDQLFDCNIKRNLRVRDKQLKVKNSANSSMVNGRIELPCDSIQSISHAFLSNHFVASSSIAVVAVLTSSLHSSGTCAWATALAARKMPSATVNGLMAYPPGKRVIAAAV